MQESETANAETNEGFSDLVNPEFYGTPFFHKEVGETFKGVYCGEGRTIGKDKDEMKTYLFVNESGAHLIPQ